MINHLKEDLQDLIERILHMLKGWTSLAALQDTKVLSDQPHTWEKLQLIYTPTHHALEYGYHKRDNSNTAFQLSHMFKYKEMLHKKLSMSPFRNANGQRGKTGHGKLQKHTIAQRIMVRKMIGEVKINKKYDIGTKII